MVTSEEVARTIPLMLKQRTIGPFRVFRTNERVAMIPLARDSPRITTTTKYVSADGMVSTQCNWFVAEIKTPNQNENLEGKLIHLEVLST